MLEIDAEERALTDGRIGPETVGIDRASLCGSMNINDGIEVYDLQIELSFNKFGVLSLYICLTVR